MWITRPLQSGWQARQVGAGLEAGIGIPARACLLTRRHAGKVEYTDREREAYLRRIVFTPGEGQAMCRLAAPRQVLGEYGTLNVEWRL